MTVIFICLTHFLLRMLYKYVVHYVTALRLHFSTGKVKETYVSLMLIGTFMFWLVLLRIVYWQKCKSCK